MFSDDMGRLQGHLGEKRVLQYEMKQTLINISYQHRNPHLILNFFASSHTNNFSVHQWDSEAINSRAFVQGLLCS